MNLTEFRNTDLWSNHARRFKWALIALICFLGLLYGYYVLDWGGYMQNWGGKMYKAMSGAALGWLISRYVLDLDLSKIAIELRPQAALSQAILIGAGMIAVASV